MSVDPTLQLPASTGHPAHSRRRGCLLAGLIALMLTFVALLAACCGGITWAQWRFGTHQFQGGLRIDAEARRAYAEAIGPNADHFLCVEDGREQYNTSFTSRRPRNEYVTFQERGITVLVEKSICDNLEWQYLRPIIIHRGPDPTANYKFGFLDADPPSGFPRVGR